MQINPITNNSNKTFEAIKLHNPPSWKQKELDMLFENTNIKAFAKNLDHQGYDILIKKINYTESQIGGPFKKNNKMLSLDIIKKDNKNSFNLAQQIYPFNNIIKKLQNSKFLQILKMLFKN